MESVSMWWHHHVLPMFKPVAVCLPEKRRFRLATHGIAHATVAMVKLHWLVAIVSSGRSGLTSVTQRPIRLQKQQKRFPTPCRVNTIWQKMVFLTLNLRGPNWLRRQDISTHDIDYVDSASSCLTWGRISTTYVMAMWRNDIKCVVWCHYNVIDFLQNNHNRHIIAHSTFIGQHWLR